jgi:hypothetical protein
VADDRGTRRRRLGAGALAALVVVVAAGCAPSGAEPGAGSAGQPLPGQPSTPVAVDWPTPDPGGTPEPTAGGLTGDDLPAATVLGPGWAAVPLAGDAEEGVVGNGTPWQERDPDDVLGLLVPLGCRQRSALPRPDAVLEATYARAGDGVPAVGLRLRLPDEARADALVAALAADVRACGAQAADPATGTGPPVARVADVGAGFTSLRVDPVADDPAQRWTEVVVGVGSDVVVVAVNLAPGDERFAGPDAIAAAVARPAAASRR